MIGLENLTIELGDDALEKLRIRRGITEIEAKLAISDHLGLHCQWIGGSRCLISGFVNEKRFVFECAVVDGESSDDKVARVISVMG